MNKHTPGPWVLDKGEDGLFICPANDLIVGIAEMMNMDRAEERKYVFGAESEANARLIAAAPDLLEACSALVEGMEASGITGEYLIAARAAISKATGEQA